MNIARLAALVLIATASSAAAQEAETRFTLEKTADGYVRMDRRTGDLSICTERSGQLVCRLAADERTAWQDEVELMGRRLEDVEKRLAALEGAPVAQNALPTEEQFEQGMTYMERFLRRFMGIAKELERESADPEAPAQKT